MKSYFANSFRVAMEQARKEMGPEAVLVTTRTASTEARHLGEYEVVFAAGLPATAENQGCAAATQKDGPQPAPAPASRVPSPHGTQTAASELGAVLAEIQGLRKQMQSWRQSDPLSWDPPPGGSGHSHARELFSELVQREVSREIAQRLTAAAENRLRLSALTGRERGVNLRREVLLNRPRLLAALAEEIRDALQVESRLGAGTSPTVVALVGPPGAGKTATIAKLAVRHGLTARKPAVLISLDTLRVGAAEQLRCYASLLGVGFQVASTNRALEQSLEEHCNKELILIDTPGFALSDLRLACDSADYLARRSDIQKHLVLPATVRYADLSRMSAAYEVFRPSRLIFTRMDETETFGGVLSEAISSERPISFFSAGQRVPEDLADADKRELSELVVPSSEINLSPLATGRTVGSLQTAA